MIQNKKSKSHRSRNRQIVVRFTDEELNVLHDKCKTSQQTLQAYALDALLHSRISTASEIQEIQMIGQHFGSANKQLQGACSNLNQMAKALNKLNRIMETQTISQQQFLSLAGLLLTQSELNTYMLTIQKWKKEMEIPWLSLRQFLALQKPMAGCGTSSNTSSEATK